MQLSGARGANHRAGSREADYRASAGLAGGGRLTIRSCQTGGLSRCIARGISGPLAIRRCRERLAIGCCR
jgi:hypothetical protein